MHGESDVIAYATANHNQRSSLSRIGVGRQGCMEFHNKAHLTRANFITAIICGTHDLFSFFIFCSNTTGRVCSLLDSRCRVTVAPLPCDSHVGMARFFSRLHKTATRHQQNRHTTAHNSHTIATRPWPIFLFLINTVSLFSRASFNFWISQWSVWLLVKTEAGG